jgi:hypothetical protein
MVFTKKNFRDSLTQWIISTDQAFTAVEAPTFQNLIKLCNAEAHIPLALTVKNDIMKEFDHEKTKICTFLQV